MPNLFDCELVTLMETVPGKVSISSTSISFDASGNENSVDGSSWDFKIALSQLREVHLRRFNHRRSALEFFLTDQTNYFINFTKEVIFSMFICHRSERAWMNHEQPINSARHKKYSRTWLHLHICSTFLPFTSILYLSFTPFLSLMVPSCSFATKSILDALGTCRVSQTFASSIEQARLFY